MHLALGPGWTRRTSTATIGCGCAYHQPSRRAARRGDGKKRVTSGKRRVQALALVELAAYPTAEFFVGEVAADVDGADQLAVLVQRLRERALSAAGMQLGDEQARSDVPELHRRDQAQQVVPVVNTHQGARIGRSAAQRQSFSDAYGWDVTRWPGYEVLREIRDLHTLGAYVDRAAAGDDPAAEELQHRIKTLRAGDAAARWHVT